MDSPSMLSPGSTTQETRGGGPAHKSGSRASTDHLPHCTLPPPRSQPIHLASGHAAQSRAISRNLGRSRGRAALSRAISERRSRGVTPAQKGRRLEAGGHAPSRAPSSPGFWPPGRRPTVAARGSRPSDGATTPRPARSPLHPAIAARTPSGQRRNFSLALPWAAEKEAYHTLPYLSLIHI